MRDLLQHWISVNHRAAKDIAGRLWMLLHDAPLSLSGHVLASLSHLRTTSTRQPKTILFKAELQFRAVTE